MTDPIYQQEHIEEIELMPTDPIAEDTIEQRLNAATDASLQSSIEETLRIEGHAEETVIPIAEKGVELLKNPTPPPTHVPSSLNRDLRSVGKNRSLKNSKQTNFPNIEGKLGYSAEITQREKLEASHEGLIELLQTLQQTLQELRQTISYGDYAKENDRIRQEIKISKLQSAIETVEKKLDELPPDQPERPLENYPEEQQQMIYEERRNKKAKLRTHKDMVATGIEFNGKYGLDAVGAVADEYDQLHKELPDSQRQDPPDTEESVNSYSEETDEEPDPYYENMDYDGSFIDPLEDPRV